MTGFWKTVRGDLSRYVGKAKVSKRQVLRTIYWEPGFQAVFVYRLGRLLHSKSNVVLLWPLLALGWVFYAPMALFIRKGYSIELSLSADIGPGFYVGHFGGVEVFGCRMAENCSVGQLTKVGRADQVDGPQIGCGVWIGAHAKIPGPVKVGDQATIAPGARVLKDVPSKSLIVGDPGRVVFRGFDNSRILPGR